MARAKTRGRQHWILAAAKPVEAAEGGPGGEEEGGRAEGAPRRRTGRWTSGCASISLVRRVATETEKEIDVCIFGQGYFGPFKWLGEVKTLQKKEKERKWMKTFESKKFAVPVSKFKRWTN